MKTDPEAHPFDKLGKPAQRALTNAGIKTPEQLAGYTVKEIMKLHGMGKASLPALNAILVDKGLAFKG
jgi:hypothetical protein